ncbi:MAG TPA: hypothetical protein PKA05_20835 [Roseiflexaceae bacterium]|nr:hypothetical protein [Roseiflexaceae bacterium]
MTQPTNYTDEDTARIREAERTSAGLQTQQLAEPIAALPQELPADTRIYPRENLAALALIGLGVLWLLNQFASQLNLTGGIVLLTIASCFYFFSFWQRIYGLLIPASILAGLSVGVTFASITGGASVLWGLALGFMTVILLGRALFGVRNNWPIFPAVALFAVGVIVIASQLTGLLAGSVLIFPLLLIVLGLVLGFYKR